MIKALPLLFLFAFPLLFAQSSKELLRDGLFAEESEGDLKTAAEKYQSLLDGFEKERRIAAVALVRLATVKRKEGDDKAALALYQDFARKFADIEPQATLVKEDYLALSGKALTTSSDDNLSAGELELARIKALEKSSPDLIATTPTGPEFGKAVENGWEEVVRYYLEKGASPDTWAALARAVNQGNLAMTQLLVEAGADLNRQGNLTDSTGRQIPSAIETPLRIAVIKNFPRITNLLLEKGANLEDLKGILSRHEVRRFDFPQLETLVKQGADPNYLGNPQSPNFPEAGPLHIAASVGNHQFAADLLKLGAKVDLEGENKLRPLHYAASNNDSKMMSLLIEAGADPNAEAGEVPSRPNRAGTTRPPIPGRVTQPVNREPTEVRQRPIDLVDLKLVPFLIERGAKPTQKVLLNVIKEGSADLLKLLVQNGADLNPELDPKTTAYYDLPLNCSLEYGTPEKTKILVENGARLADAVWKLLTPELRIKRARENLYAAMATPGDLTVFFPESPNQKQGTQTIKIERDANEAFLKVRIPCLTEYTGNTGLIDLSSLTWKVYREGKMMDLPMDPLPNPALEAGDVLEITGFESPYFNNQQDRWVELKNYGHQKLPVELLRTQRFPVKVTLNDRTCDLLVCPDKVCWDVRTNEIPDVSVSELLGLLGPTPFDSEHSSAIRTIKIKREGFGELSLDDRDRALESYPLEPNDHIKVTWTRPERESEISSRTRNKSVEAFLPGAPGNWRWVIGDLNPSLLQVIVQLNPGFNGIYDPKNGVPTHQLVNIPALRTIPSLDLSSLKVHRLTDDGEETITINLNAKIAEWIEGGRKDTPFDMELQERDRLELKARNDGPLGFSEEESAYLKAAFNIPLMLKEHYIAPQNLGTNFHPVQWVEIFGEPIPVELPETKSNLLDVPLPVSIRTYTVQREGKVYDMDRSVPYWPRRGDVILATPEGGARRNPISKAPVPPPATRATPAPKTSSSARQRTRYVPLPKR